MLHVEPQLLINSGALVGNRYQLLEALGAGGMGWVFRARDVKLDQMEVALKFLYPHLVSDSHALARFRNEVLVARKLIHPSIVRTFTFESDQHHAYIVMEYVSGRTLKEHLATECPAGMSADLAISTALEIAVAMHHSHMFGVIHRDLKPDNVMLSHEREVKVSDFGLASSMRRQGEHTNAGQLLGTPYYMAPEQFRGEVLDTRADIYSFGILLFELLYGVVPFDDVSLYALAKKHERCAIQPPPGRTTDVPGPMWDIVEKATRKVARERFESFAEVVHALEALAPAPSKLGLTAAPSSQEPDDQPPATPQRRRISKRFLLFEIVAALLLAIYWVRTNSIIRTYVTIPLLRFEQATNIRLSTLRTILAIPIELNSTSLAEDYERGAFGLVPRIWTGEDPNSERNRNSRGQYVLHLAVKNADADAFGFLLNSDADPNVRAHDGTTPLHEAANNHLYAFADRLLQKGALPDLAASNSLTPLLRAAQTKDSALALLLLSAGADPLRFDAEGLNTMMHATITGDLQVLEASVLALQHRLTSIVGLK